MVTYHCGKCSFFSFEGHCIMLALLIYLGKEARFNLTGEKSNKTRFYSPVNSSFLTCVDKANVIQRSYVFSSICAIYYTVSFATPPQISVLIQRFFQLFSLILQFLI